MGWSKGLGMVPQVDIMDDKFNWLDLSCSSGLVYGEGP
jgi:hypothetical protein